MTISKLHEKNNLIIYEDSKTVEYYRRAEGLQPCEQYIFSKYIRSTLDILDLGVGGGRTTPYLAAENRRYVGVDYSKAMTEICRAKFPELPFHTLDASDLSYFESGSFDSIVYSFNGIDYLFPDEQRMKCMLEVNRLLRAKGLFIFSVHNAKAVIVYPQLHAIHFSRVVWRILRSIVKSALLFSRQIRCKAFYSGAGYVIDPAHGGLLTHTSTPHLVERELAESGFVLLEVINGNYPIRSGTLATPWFYYVANKI